MSQETAVSVTTVGHTTVTVTRANGEVEVSTTLNEGAIVTTTVNGEVSVPTEVVGEVEVNVSPVQTVVVDVTPMSPVQVNVTSGAFAGAGSNSITALTGDVTATGPGSVVATLASTGVTPGAYTNLNATIDDKGRVTAAANGSAGDMTKAVYDPQNLGYISGDDATGTGGFLNMDASAFTGGNGGNIDTSAGSAIVTAGGDVDTSGGSAGGATGGRIRTHGGSAADANGGEISTYGGSNTNARGGDIHAHGGTAASARGGDIHVEGGTLPGGDIDTRDGGGSINTRGVGSIGMGVAATRTTIVGSATAPRAHVTPDKDGTYAMTSDIPSVANFNTFIHPPVVSTTTDSTATAIPLDTSLPQSGEGKEYLTFTMTPKDASSVLEIEFTAMVGGSTNMAVMVALFKDSDASSIEVIAIPVANNAQVWPVTLRHRVAVAGAGSRVYKIRFGGNTGTAYMLRSAATDYFSGGKQAVFTVKEILP